MPKSRVTCRLTSVPGWSVRADWEGIRFGKEGVGEFGNVFSTPFQYPIAKTW
jgi:hypothetical protein